PLQQAPQDIRVALRIVRQQVDVDALPRQRVIGQPHALVKVKDELVLLLVGRRIQRRSQKRKEQRDVVSFFEHWLRRVVDHKLFAWQVECREDGIKEPLVLKVDG